MCVHNTINTLGINTNIFTNHIISISDTQGSSLNRGRSQYQYIEGAGHISAEQASMD